MHGRDHRPGGTDPIVGFPYNDWVIASTTLSVPDSTDTSLGFSSITHQTDDGSVYGIDTGGALDAIAMLQVGSYLVRIIGDFGAGHSGTAAADGTLGGPLTAYDYFVVGGVGNLLSLATFSGITVWEQLVTVNDLSATSGCTAEVRQTSGGTLNPVIVTLQIIRFT